MLEDSTTKGGTVLAVDDDPAVLELITLSLERDGHHVVTAVSVHGGLEALEKEFFDVAIFDVDLPDGKGFQLAEFLREVPPSATSIIMITGTRHLDYVEMSLTMGSED